MHGNIQGALVALTVYLTFQLCGMLCAFAALRNKHFGLRLLVGSVLGTVLFQWLPILYAFFFGFSITAHVLALLTALALGVLVWKWKRLSLKDLLPPPLKLDFLLVLPAGVSFLLFSALAIHSFRAIDGAIFSSQCSYSDMSMHLGFITSIAQQGSIPPQYSILPGTQLAYPFLSDSISSSLYLMGMPLTAAYLLPMFFAAAQVMAGFTLFMWRWLRSSGKVALAFLLFFWNGGFGFFYFLSGTQQNAAGFTRIFTEFYQTPTNLINENIRWVNVMVDLMIPQRALLFGWAVLFAALCLLFDAIKSKSKTSFLLTGVLAASLPMIHTHSFLALGLISAGWLLGELVEAGSPNVRSGVLRGLLLGFPFAMTLLQLCLGERKEVSWLLPLAGVYLFAFCAYGMWLIAARRKARAVLSGFAIYLGIVLVLALPQLLFWTFRQATGEQFVRGYFNWGNLNDNYLWFYLKNMGVAALLYFPAVLWANQRSLRVIAPIVLIMPLCELVLFQPNPYDNNKLIYIAFFLFCGLAADYCVEGFGKLKGLRGRWALAATVLFFCTFSAILTVGREAVAKYMIFSKEQIKAAQFVSATTQPDAIILTDGRHNNAIAALTGRNIVCGSPVFLYYHGLDYAEREKDVATMYQSPAQSEALFALYDVDYIMVSDYEMMSYAVDIAGLEAMFPLVYNDGDVRLYQVHTNESVVPAHADARELA